MIYFQEPACQTSFFPQTCPWGDKTEDVMWQVADEVTLALGNNTVGVSPHAYREIYSSGGHADWPAYRDNLSYNG